MTTTITPPIALARRARHRKPNRRRGAIATATGILILIAAVLSLTAAAVHHAPAFGGISPQTAVKAYTQPAETTAVNWTARTCNAVLAVQDHATTRNVNTLAADAGHLTGRTYLRADVYEVLADAASPSAKSRQYLDVALQYAGEDCYGGA